MLIAWCSMAERAEGGIDVSVIVAVRNGAGTFAQCIDSVLAQTGCRVELIIVDALSDDGTQQIVESYGNAVASYIREADRGIYDAWNKALAVARGDWCSFLGADDYYVNEQSVATLLRCAGESAGKPVFVFGGVLRTGGAEDYVVHPDPPDALAYLRSGRMLPHQGFLHHLGSLRSIGGFDASFRILGDFDAVLELAKVGAVRRADAVVTVMRIGGISSSWKGQRRRHSERWRILQREIGIRAALPVVAGPAILEYVGYAIEGVLLSVLGRRQGLASTLALRRRFGGVPRIHREV